MAQLLGNRSRLDLEQAWRKNLHLRVGVEGVRVGRSDGADGGLGVAPSDRVQDRLHIHKIPDAVSERDREYCLWPLHHICWHTVSLPVRAPRTALTKDCCAVVAASYLCRSNTLRRKVGLIITKKTNGCFKSTIMSPR